MDIIQSFYDDLASKYDKLFHDWDSTIQEQAIILDKIFAAHGYDRSAEVLDCACGIGTQAIGLAELGYGVTASDISDAELEEGKTRAQKHQVSIPFVHADFRTLSEVFSQQFDIVIVMDNALPHMLSPKDLEQAMGSIIDRLKGGGLFVASIRDYDALLMSKPPYSPPYIHKTPEGQRVSFQTWTWDGNIYHLTQYIIEDGATLQVSKFQCAYRATTRDELTNILTAKGCKDVKWLTPEESGFYQPIVVAHK